MEGEICFKVVGSILITIRIYRIIVRNESAGFFLVCSSFYNPIKNIRCYLLILPASQQHQRTGMPGFRTGCFYHLFKFGIFGTRIKNNTLRFQA